MSRTTLKRTLWRIALLLAPHKHNLGILARKYGTDKYLNRYYTHYQFHFGRLRHKHISILEIGVGGGGNPKRGGSSLRMWQDFFPNGMIYGLDIYDKKIHEDKRIRVFQGDQSDPDFLKEVVQEIGELNIVIDDGSHISRHVLTSFEILFPFLSEDGIYAIEDLCTSYWPEYGGEWENLGSASTSVGMLKGLVDGLNYCKIPNYRPSAFDRHITSIHFYHSLAFVCKGVNEPFLSDIDHEILAANRRDDGSAG